METLAEFDFINEVILEDMEMGTGMASLQMSAKEHLFMRHWEK